MTHVAREKTKLLNRLKRIRGQLEAIERAWTKAVHLHVTLWTRPYSRDGLW